MGSFVFEQVVNGIITGSMYALIAAGMTMIFGVLRAINFAHGEYYMLGTFGAWLVIEKMDVGYAASIVVNGKQHGGTLRPIIRQRNVQQTHRRGMLALTREIDAALIVDAQQCRTFAVGDIGRLTAGSAQCKCRV